jgi:hypothetical protein
VFYVINFYLKNCILRHQFFIADSAINWPEPQKEKLTAYLEYCNQLDLDTEQRTLLTGIIHQLKHHQFNQYNWDSNNALQRELDLVRSEQHKVLFTPAFL